MIFTRKGSLVCKQDLLSHSGAWTWVMLEQTVNEQMILTVAFSTDEIYI